MATNTIKTRIQLKNDTEANWNKATNFKPKQGEIIIYSADGTHPFSRLKVGDGDTKVSDLPFIDANTITGYTVLTNVPANAVFTDSTVELVDLTESGGA